MADYNLLVDKLNTDAERIEITNEVAELKTQNESESRDVDSIFAEKQGRLIGVAFSFHIILPIKDPIATFSCPGFNNDFLQDDHPKLRGWKGKLKRSGIWPIT